MHPYPVSQVHSKDGAAVVVAGAAVVVAGAAVVVVSS